MAKKAKLKKKATLNTDLDDSVRKSSEDDFTSDTDNVGYKSEDDYGDVEPPVADLTEGSGDDITYTMGDIQVSAGDDENDENEEFKKASKNLIKDSDSDGQEDEEWIEEDINTEDTDPFLDMEEDFDMDNPYGQED